MSSEKFAYSQRIQQLRGGSGEIQPDSKAGVQNNNKKVGRREQGQEKNV